MSHSKRVVFTFTSSWKTAKSLILSVGNKIIAPAGENFMPVSLVSHIPNQLIVGRIENIMECNGQFNHAKARTKMTPMNADNINDVLAQFVANLVKLFAGEFL